MLFCVISVFSCFQIVLDIFSCYGFAFKITDYYVIAKIHLRFVYRFL